jgi:hypothetical protein
MKQDYSKPVLEDIGLVREVTASNGSAFALDVPYGQILSSLNPHAPGFGILGSN